MYDYVFVYAAIIQFKDDCQDVNKNWINYIWIFYVALSQLAFLIDQQVNNIVSKQNVFFRN